MTEQAKLNEQLTDEILSLKQENQALSAELAFHRKIFRQVHEALGAAESLRSAIKKNEAIRQLVEENEKLKNEIKVARLSEREREVLKFIVNGYTSKEIAENLNISKLTVDTHRKHIQQKLEVSHVAGMIKIALSLDLY